MSLCHRLHRWENYDGHGKIDVYLFPVQIFHAATIKNKVNSGMFFVFRGQDIFVVFTTICQLWSLSIALLAPGPQGGRNGAFVGGHGVGGV